MGYTSKIAISFAVAEMGSFVSDPPKSWSAGQSAAVDEPRRVSTRLIRVYAYRHTLQGEHLDDAEALRAHLHDEECYLSAYNSPPSARG
jgi:hypothetical protein